MEHAGELKRTIYTVIAKRLLIAALCVAPLFSIVAYYHSWEMLYASAKHMSQAQIHFIRARLLDLIADIPVKGGNAVLEAVLDFPPATELHIQEGKFVYVVLYDNKLENQAIYKHEELQDADAIKRFIFERIDLHDAHKPEGFEFHPVKINKKKYLEIHHVVYSDQTGFYISLRALFAFSDLSDEKLKIFIVKNVLLVIGVVMGTALLMYPVVTILFERLARYSCKLMTAHIETMESLGETIAKRDNDTSTHNYRVAVYAVLLAEAANYPKSLMQSLVKGSFLHDIGKIGIRDNILLTDERHNPKQQEIMRTHVSHGVDIISRSSWLNDALDIVSHHHERYDGLGYPDRLAGTQIPLGARIFTIVDIFDALTSKRPYKTALDYDEAIMRMKKDFKGYFDPDLFDLFLLLSRQLYYDYASKRDSEVVEKFHKITNDYFYCDCCSWLVSTGPKNCPSDK